jgi:hypothetical protein
MTDVEVIAVQRRYHCFRPFLLTVGSWIFRIIPADEVKNILNVTDSRVDYLAAATTFDRLSVGGADITITEANVIRLVDVAGLVARVRRERGPVLVVGHSNTVPEIVAALGGAKPEPIPDSAYGDIWHVAPGGAVEKNGLGGR